MAEDNKFVAKPEKGISSEEGVFLASLVCNLRYTEHLNLQISCAEIITSIESQRSSSLRLRVISFTGQRILTWDGPETKGAKTLRLDCQQRSATSPGSSEVTDIGPTCCDKLQFWDIYPHLSFTDSLCGSLSSPHGEVDNFVLTLVKKDGIQGSKWWVTLSKWVTLNEADWFHLNRHQTMELLCSWTTACVWHRQVPLVWKCAAVSQEQQHHVRLFRTL